MSIEFKWRREESGDVVPCVSCNCEAPTAGFDCSPSSAFDAGAPKPQRMLCEFCSSTMASKRTEYWTPDPYLILRAEIWRAAGAVFNMLKHGEAPK